MHVQDFLKNGGTVAQLEEQWGIDATYSEKYPELVLLKYNQIESPMAAPIVQECRGLVLCTKDWSVVAWPFSKFFNEGEPLAAEIDWSTAKVYEKADGSLITMYWYDDQWLVATSGNPDAGGNVNGFDMDFATLFWDTFRAMGLPTDRLNPDYTYMWELCTPYNRIVVQHKEPFVVLTGCRNRVTGQEYDAAEIAGALDVPCVNTFAMGSMEAVKYTASGLKGMEQEGFVVVDAAFNRVKVKGAHYVSLHMMRDRFAGPKAFLEVVRKGESDEFLTYFPEFADIFNGIKLRWRVFCSACDSDWQATAAAVDTDGWSKSVEFPIKIWLGVGDANRKAFAAVAKTKRCPGYLFARLDRKVENCAQYLSTMPIDNVMRLLELK